MNAGAMLTIPHMLQVRSQVNTFFGCNLLFTLVLYFDFQLTPQQPPQLPQPQQLLQLQQM